MVVSAAGGSGAPPAPATDPTEVAAREQLLQKVQQKANAAELEAQKRAEEAQQHEREAKRLKRELEEAKQQMAALQRAAQLLASAQHPPQQHAQPGQQPVAQGPALEAQRHGYAPGPRGAHGPPPPQYPYGGAAGPAPLTQHGAAPPGLAADAAGMRCHSQAPHQHAYAGAPAGAAWGGGAPGGTGHVAPNTASSSSMWGHFPDSTQGTHSALAAQRGGPSAVPSYPTAQLPPVPASSVSAVNGGGGAADAGDGGRFKWLFGVPVEGCRLVALDVAGSRVLASESPGGGGGGSCIRNISMVSPECWTRIRLPPSASIVLDMQLAPAAPAASGPSGSLTAVVTRGAGLCLVSHQHDTVVAAFSGLPQRPWSCSWVPPGASAAGTAAYGEHLLVAGLEKGHLALLDVRRTDRPVAVVSVLQGDPRGCGQLPVRTVAALPPCAPPAASVGGVAWPSVALSCTKGAWLMVGGGGVEAAGSGAVPVLLQLDGGFGAGGMQVESLAVSPAGGEEAGCGRVALSWRPVDGAAGAGAVATPVPRHEVGVIRTDPQAPYRHEVTVQKYTRRGIQAVRSCLLPAPLAPSFAPGGGPQPPALAGGLQLASSDDDSRRPLIWSLGSGGLGNVGGAAEAHVAQWLDPHPQPPACMVAATGLGGGGAGADCFLGCASQSLVAVYRRRAVL